MVFTCCIPGCNTGYRSNASKEKISLYKFPKDENMRQKWIRAIPRKDWIPTDSHRVCAKHFHKDDFVVASADSKINRRNSREKNSLQRKRAKPEAIPRIFAGLPSYLSTSAASERSTSCSSSARVTRENTLITNHNNEFLMKDNVENLKMLKDKLKDEILPEGFTTITSEESIQFHYIYCSPNPKEAPDLPISLTITSDLIVHAYIYGTLLSHDVYEDLIPAGIISKMSQLLNVLALCKSISVDSGISAAGSGSKQKKKQFLSLTIQMLQRFIDEQQASQDVESSQLELVQFMIEQLQLMQVHKNGRRYSTSMLKTAFLWQLTSNSLYKKLNSFFVLPSVRRLQTLSAGTAVTSGSIDVGYLKERVKNLSDKEKIVTLILDEVYIAERVEYSNGSFIGLTENGTPAKTVLGFMVQSVCSNYKDIVCLIPVATLNTSVLQKWFTKVMTALHDIFIVIAVSADNHICNRYVIYDL